jgi:hypothetical protein
MPSASHADPRSTAVNFQLLTTVRELHSRVTDGLHVRLFWNPQDDSTTVAVLDTKNGESFQIDVRPGEHALDVFHHPFAYAAQRGIPTGALLAIAA